MTSNLPAVRKTITAAVGAVLTWAAVVVTSAPAAITSSEWLLAGGSLATALGVYGVKNEPAPNEGGQTNIWTVVGVLVALGLVIWLVRGAPT